VRLASVPFVQLWRHHDARCLNLGVFFHSLSMVGEQVVLGWFILELTNSALMVGVALGLRNLPLLLVGIPAGVVADRGDRVKLLQASGIAMALITTTLGFLVALGIASVWPVLALTFITGCARALHQTARQGYAHDVAGPGGLVHALALVAFTSRVGGLVGSLLTGFLIARSGSAVAYLAVATGYVASAAAMLPARSNGRPSGAGTSSVSADVFDFLGTIRRDRVLLHLMSLTAVAEVLGFSHQALLPSLARDVLRVGPEGLGVMTAARQVGGLIGIALASTLGAARSLGPLFLTVLVAFGASLVSLGLAGTFVVVVLMFMMLVLFLMVVMMFAMMAFVLIFMMMLMRMRMRMRHAVSMRVLVTVPMRKMNVEFYSANGGFLASRKVQMVTTQRQLSQLPLQLAAIDAQIDQRAEKHVAADSAEDVQVECAHIL